MFDQSCICKLNAAPGSQQESIWIQWDYKKALSLYKENKNKQQWNQ